MSRSSLRPGELELPPGTRILDRYSLLDWIGSGGMATIYRATDERLDRVVCIKLLRTMVEGPDSKSGSRAVYQATYTHFLKEALALSKLQHPNTLRIYDFGYLKGEGDGQGAPLHVSEYLDGGNLETRVRASGPLSPQETVGILFAISEAVAEAHEQGILHRDIKPSNILFARVRGDLVPKLADFGIAHSNIPKPGPPGEMAESVSTVALFSPRWAAPEQLCGTPEDPRTDVYALGLLIVFMLTGTVFFGDEDVSTTFEDRVRGDALVTARLAQLDLAPDVKKVIANALRARPQDRTRTAPDLAHALKRAVEPLAASASTPSLSLGAPELTSTPRGGVEVPAEGAAELQLEPQAETNERVVVHGNQRFRYVHVHEKLDLSVRDSNGGRVRFRVTILPGQTTSVNVKGLSCFVAKQGGKSTSALIAQENCSVELVSAARQILGKVGIHFGDRAPNGHLFLLDGRQLLVTYVEAQQAVVLSLGRGADIVVMCRS